MKLRLYGVLLGLLMTIPALSQSYTVITSTNMLVDNGSGTAINPPSGSQLCFQGTNAAGQPITYTPAGGSPVTGPVCQTYNSSGGLTGSLQVANGATASPSGLLYTITITNGSTTYLTLTKVSVSGTLFQIDQYSIPGNGAVSGIGYPHIGCNPGAQWASTTISPGASTCALVGGVGAWTSYPQASYCPAGQGYIVPQVTGIPFCISPQLQGLGAPSGTYPNKTLYFQQDAASGQFLWGVVNGAWQQITGGSGGGLTSFQGRTTAAATLMASDITGLLANSPFSFTGSLGLVYDSASGTPTPSSAWKFDGSNNLGGTQNLYLGASPFSAPVITLNASTGAVTAANGSFTVSGGGALAFGGGGSISSSSNICQTSGTNCPSSATVYYQVVQNNGASLTPRSRLAFAPTTGIQAVDDSGNNSSDISLIQASSSQFGAVKVDGTTITASGGVISSTCPTATLSALGCVKPDGTSISITGGVISTITLCGSPTIAGEVCNSTGSGAASWTATPTLTSLTVGLVQDSGGVDQLTLASGASIIHSAADSNQALLVEESSSSATGDALDIVQRGTGYLINASSGLSNYFRVDKFGNVTDLNNITAGGFQIGALTILTSLSSANSQIVTCPASGTGTQYCGADGNWHTASGSSISGMTSGQVAIAGSATTITSSKALAGSGSGITTGPTTTTGNDVMVASGTGGQIADSGVLYTNLAVTNSGNTFSGSQTISGGSNLLFTTSGSYVSGPTTSTQLQFNTAGVALQRNVSDANPVFTIHPLSGTGMYLELENSSSAVVGGFTGGANLLLGAASASTSGSNISIGNTTTAASSCGSLSGASGCLEFYIGSTPHYAPYY